MNSLIRHIEYLMSRNDCVIIPGIGAVLAHYQSARIDCDVLTIVPPTRAFAFNPALKQSDGLLACSVAQAEGISYEAACSLVATHAEAMLRQLHAQGELPLGRIGTLSMPDGATAPEFRAFVSPLSSAATCGLPMVDFAVAAVVPDTSAEAAVVNYYSPAGRFVRVAASVALLVGVCFVASTPISVDQAALASLTPTVQKAPIEDLLPASASSTADQEQMPVLRITGSSMPLAEIEKPIEQPAAPAPKYLLIVGSFSTIDEARRFIGLNDPSWQIIEADGRVRVYSAGFAEQSEAYNAVRENREKYAGAWVYTVKGC